MMFKYELRFVAFTRPNHCLWGRNFVSGIYKLKNLKKSQTEKIVKTRSGPTGKW